MARKKTDDTTKKTSTASTPAAKKTSTAKKPAAKKPVGGGRKRAAATDKATKAVATRAREPEVRVSAPGQSEHRQDLLNQIVDIAVRLEDDGLELLLSQANVVEYKGKIEKFNRRINVAAQEALQARRDAARPDYSVTIERTDDDFFVIQLDDARVFFNINEMREITRICHKAKDANAGARNLFRWFERERSDLLADVGISSNRSPYLLELYEVIVSTYKVRE